ncbi:MAG: TonB-dependent receptor plug domain-containing protein [Muribaculaceae bacterium]
MKYSPSDNITIRASVGKGYRSPHALSENVSILATGKKFFAYETLSQEKAWNTGASLMTTIPIAGKNLELNVDYYYTDFDNQMVIVPDGKRGSNTFSIENLNGKSYSHTLQIDATYPFFDGFTATGAFRYTDSRVTYDGVLQPRPLTSQYKGLLTLGYKTPLELWHFDVTGSVNGSGYLYDGSSYPTYFQLQAQVTREFRNFAVYVGGENLTNYIINNAIRGASNPWSADFDATQVWGPTDGAMLYVGVRYNFEKI